MRTTTLHLALLAPALLGLASTASADYLKLKSGKVLEGAATAYDEDTSIITFITKSGEELKLDAEDLDRTSAYKLAKTKAEKGNAEHELRLGHFARDIELYAHANRHYGNAEKLDPSIAGQVEEARVRLSSEAAAYCMKEARDAQRRNDPKEAERWLTILVEKLPNEPLAEEAASMLGETYARNHEAQDDELEASLEAVLTSELKTGKKHYDAMLASIQKGLTNTRTNSVAKRAYERAWTSGEKSLKELDKVQKKLAKEQPSLPALFDSYREIIHEHMVSAQLHLASALTVQTDYKDALKAVNKALAIDSGNRDALAARARIEDLSNRGWGWNR